jgi:hypothetical protein
LFATFCQAKEFKISENSMPNICRVLTNTAGEDQKIDAAKERRGTADRFADAGPMRA